VISPCASTGWSAVSSALANATVAGLLAGFMLNGIVVLLSRQPDRAQRIGYVQAASLLFGAFVTLGLDSFLFGLVTGDTSQVACRRAWSEAMVAAGLLGLGTVTVVVSIVFLLGVFFEPTVRTAVAGAHEGPGGGAQAGEPGPPDDGRDEDSVWKSNNLLNALCSLLRPAVALLVVGLLVMTAVSYLFALFRGHAPAWMYYLVWAAWGLDYVVIGLFCLLYILYVWDGRMGPARQEAPIRPARGLSWLATVVRDRVLKILRGSLTATLRWGIFLTVGYTLAGVGWTIAFITIPVHIWNSSSRWVDVIVVFTVIWVLVGSLVPMAALLVPSFGPKASPEPKRDLR
jgi:hypothetical protein